MRQFQNGSLFSVFYLEEIECNTQFDSWCLVVPISKDNIRNIVTLTIGKGSRKRSVRVIYWWPPIPLLCGDCLLTFTLTIQYSETRNTSYTFLMERFTLQMQTINYVQCCRNLSTVKKLVIETLNAS